jgi:hypothetical protein
MLADKHLASTNQYSGRILAGWNGNATSRDASNTGMSCGLVKTAKRRLWK